MRAPRPAAYADAGCPTWRSRPAAACRRLNAAGKAEIGGKLSAALEQTGVRDADGETGTSASDGKVDPVFRPNDALFKEWSIGFDPKSGFHFWVRCSSVIMEKSNRLSRFASALGHDDAQLREVTTQGIDTGCPLLDQKVAGSMRHKGALLLRAPTSRTSSPGAALPAPSPADCGCGLSGHLSRRVALCFITPKSEQSRTKHGSSMNLMTEPGGPESKASRSAGHAALTSILVAFFAFSLFGKETVRTPFLKLASIFSESTPSGRRKERWNEP